MKFGYILKITAFTALFVIAGALNSCKKYLELEPKSAFDEGFVFSSVGNATSAVLGAYASLSGQEGYGIRINLYYPYDNDEMIGQEGESDADNDRRNIARYAATGGNAQLEKPFNQMYAGIERANICIKKIPEMDLYNNGSESVKSQLKRLYGEALTIRAQLYFEVIRNWGDVPAPFTPSADQPDLFLPKTDRDVIYDKLLEDLKLAATIVPWRTEVASDERITKGAVKGLRARIALYRGGYSLRRESKLMERKPDFLTYYTIARDECKEIMDRPDQHKLNPSFQSVFKDYIDAHKVDNVYGEVMFEVAMSGEGPANDSKLGYYDGPRAAVTPGSTTKGNSAIRVIPTYFYSFADADQRRDVTVAAYYFDQNNIKIGQPLNNLLSAKFRRDWITNPAYPNSSDLQFFGVNWPLLRFSDVLLMFAEAENELNNGPTAAAKTAFESVRTRGFGGNSALIGITPSSKQGFFDAIAKERSLEFGGEGIRKYDLIRWNLLKTKIDQTKAEMTQLANATGPYSDIPKVMYYKNNSTTLEWATPLRGVPAPLTTPAGFTRVNWTHNAPDVAAALNANVTLFFITQLAQKFVQNHSELLPLPQSAINSNPSIKQDYGY